MRFGTATPNIHREMRRARELWRKRVYRACQIATDVNSKRGQRRVQDRIRAVGLGGLANAVGQSSSLKKRSSTGNPWGGIYARGQAKEDSRAPGALEIYSKGGTIRPLKGRWLWIPTAAAPKRIARYKATPERYRASGSPLGPLKFAEISASYAIAYVERVGVSVKTGRARALPKRKSMTVVPARRVVLFEGIRFTRRMKRFDQRQEFGQEARKLPRDIGDALAALDRG